MSKMKGKERPRNDRFHDDAGQHRTEPPPNVNEAVWRREMRLHQESHGFDRMINDILAVPAEPPPPILPPDAPAVHIAWRRGL
jgi:hypothetical protein